jgi:hypothetical protein
MDAAGYTYLKLRTSNGAVWAAVRKARVTQGQTVVVADPQLMKNFRSRSLKRTFDEIYFGQLAGGDRGAVGRKGGRGHAGPGAGGKSAVEAHRDAKHVRATFAQPVPKAPGAQGRTVAEVYAQRKALAGQPVTVRAKVVKVSRNIMGKNWVHLQDGTAHGKDFDLTVTTQADAKVGDVVLATGTVQADKDLGAGYFYKVLVAGAKLTPAPDARRAPPRARPASPASSADGATAPARRAARASMAPGARSTR